jgi:succinoglycan biosynthesis protein ExoA
MFSVIIPTFQSAATLAKTISRILNQTIPAIEVIISDGGSTDGTQDIAQQYGVRIIQNPLVHAAGGRNAGAAQAKGDWLAFTDSDCIPEKDWLEKAEDSIKNNPDIVGLGGIIIATPPRNEIESVAGNALLQGVLQFPSYLQRINHRSLRGAFITANVFYKKDAFWEMNGFNETFANYAEDIDFFWRIGDQYPGKLLFDPRIVVKHQFPNTLRKLFWKWHQYGINSCFLQKYHGLKVNIDTSHYLRLVTSLFALAVQRDQRRKNIARIVQLTGHLYGKLHGSCKLKVINI